MSTHAYTASALEEIAAHLGDAHKTGSGWSCRCPAHDDSKPSLSLSVGEGGRLLWKCHAGCSQGAVREALQAADTRGNGDSRPAERQATRKRGRMVASYPCVDGQGVLRFEVVRYAEPNGFRQRCAEGKGGWIWKLGGARRVLYGLPEVRAANEL